jgi:hypothetical protein
MQPAAILAIATLPLLAGCATSCFDQLFYKPTAAASETFESVRTVENRLWLRNRTFSLEISECGWAYRRPDRGPASLCVWLTPSDPSTVAALSGNSIGIFDTSGVQLGQLELKPAGTLPDRTKVGETVVLSGAFPVLSPSEFVVRLPNVLVPGGKVDLPEVNLRRVTETLCRGSY